MADKDIVFVNYNYRTGSFGWMGHPELSAEMLATTGHNVSGNWGVYDQFAALKWIKKNIQHFGGDPHHVTVMGQSAGSAATYHVRSQPLRSNTIHADMPSSDPQQPPNQRRHRRRHNRKRSPRSPRPSPPNPSRRLHRPPHQRRPRPLIPRLPKRKHHSSSTSFTLHIPRHLPLHIRQLQRLQLERMSRPLRLTRQIHRYPASWSK